MPPQPPAELPGNVGHGGATAYNNYRCRCGDCLEWRRSYDRDYWEWAQRQRQRNERKS